MPVDSRLRDPVCRECPERRWCNDARSSLWTGGAPVCRSELLAAAFAFRAVEEGLRRRALLPKEERRDVGT